MLAVVVQLLLDAVLSSDCCVVAEVSRTGRASSRAEFEPQLEPSAGAENASNALVIGASNLILTATPPLLFAGISIARIEKKRLFRP
jgi:hypothetical protein